MGATMIGPRTALLNRCAGLGAVKVTVARAGTIGLPASGARPHLVGIQARRNVDGDDRPVSLRERLDRIRVEALHRRTKAGAQNAVDEHVGLVHLLSGHASQLFRIARQHRLKRQSLEHRRSIALEFAGIGQQQNGNLHPGLVQLARGDKAIAAIVPLAADDADAFGAEVASQDEIGDRRPGVLHQRERRDAEALAGGAVDLAHFGGSDDLHRVRAVAVSSSRRRLAGSPMAIR